MYNPPGCPLATCGVYVGSGIATAIALLCLPAPFILYKRGASIRKKCKYAAEAAAVLERMDQQMRAQAKRKNRGLSEAEARLEEEGEKKESPARDEEEAVAGAETAVPSPSPSSHSERNLSIDAGREAPEKQRGGI